LSLTALLFLILFLVGSLAALVRHPIFGLMTYVAVFYVHPPARWWGQGPFMEDVRWSLAAAGVTVLAMLLHRPVQPTVQLRKTAAMWFLLAFIGWIAIQSNWALDAEAHAYLLGLYLKFAIVIWMICRCIDTEPHLRLFLWTHVAGCFYLGWLAYFTYMGGRLDGVGGPGIDEANAAALQMTTGVFVASSLFLVGGLIARTALLLMLPFMVNGLVATISRSGFLAAFTGGLAYVFSAPVKYRRRVWVLAALAAAMFAVLSNQVYWDRISTIQYAGQEVQGVDTGSGRLEIIKAQWRMFRLRPLGCGHWCTTVLSPDYLDEKYLVRGEARASHNTLMTMLVDHGIPGGVLYVLMLFWIYRTFRHTQQSMRGGPAFLAAALTAVAASLVAVTIGDLFVQYPRSEVRIWFIGLLIVLQHMAQPAGLRPGGTGVEPNALETLEQK
jgi:O-antigen ligase